METSFLGMPDVTPWLFFAFAAASFCTTFIGVVTGTAGGLMLLAILAMVFPPVVLIPMHTLIMLGVGSSRAIIWRRFIMTGTVVPFTIGCAFGAVAGANIFITLPTGILQGILAVFIIFAVWVPSIGKIGSERGRLVILGFAGTFFGMFVSATGSLVGAIVASAADDRRKFIATMGALMSIVHITKIIAFGVLGVAISTYLPLIAAMIATAALANWSGGHTLARIKERWFRIAFRIFMTALALRLLWVAAHEMQLFS